MGRSGRWIAGLSLALATAAGGLVSAQQTPAPAQGAAAPPATTVVTPRRGDLAGTWRYNADASVNAATGQPETNRAVNERRGVGQGRGGGFRGGGRRGGAVGGYGGSNVGVSLYEQQRDTLRDLLEIAPELTITGLPDVVTVTDDLDRVLQFTPDEQKRSYQLGAAMFTAKAHWADGRLVLDMEGPQGLVVTETLFTSEGGAQMFVVIRVGHPAKDAPPVGVNRVYNRVR